MESESLGVLVPGRGIAAGQRICTAKGAVSAAELARGGFDAVCFDFKARRYVTRPAKAVSSGRKSVIRLHTDKGSFELAAEQPIVLADGECVQAAELTPGTRLCACTLKPEAGYLVRSSDSARPQFALDHLTEADCAVANWYPVPSVENAGEAEVYEIEIATGASNVMLWSVGPDGGIGIAVALGGGTA